jgi:hypothetical protein
LALVARAPPFQAGVVVVLGGCPQLQMLHQMVVQEVRQIVVLMRMPLIKKVVAEIQVVRILCLVHLEIRGVQELVVY